MLIGRDSGTKTAPHESKKPLSHALWGNDWQNDLFAGTLDAGHLITCAPLDWDGLRQFVTEHGADLFQAGGESPYLNDSSHAARERFYREAADIYGIYVATDASGGAKTLAGIAVGNPSDWASYYYRYFHMRARYQRLGAFRAFTMKLLGCLQRARVDRIYADTNVSNAPLMAGLISMGFRTSALQLTDRWGAMIRLTRCLNEAAAAAFDNQYVHYNFVSSHDPKERRTP